MGLWKLIVPEAITNLITNPSFETNTTSWSPSGANTIAQDTTEALWGYNSLKCTYQDNTTLASYIPTVVNGTSYFFTAWVYIPSAWGGGALSLSTSGYVGITIDTSPTTTTTTDQWVRLVLGFTPAADVTGTILLQTGSAAAANDFVYLDGVQLEANNYGTTYIDGDQDGGTWTGVAHASTSTRDRFAASGGRVRDFADDFALPIGTMQGVGNPNPINVNQPYAIIDGALLQSIKYPARTFVLQDCVFDSDTVNSLATLHSARQDLEKALDSTVGRIDEPPQPRTLRYELSDTTFTNKQIRAVLDGGLEMNKLEGSANETISMRFIAHDPFWRQIGKSSAVLDVSDSATFRAVARKTEGAGVWDNMNEPNAAGTYTSILAIETAQDAVYFGGDFTNFDNLDGVGTTADYLIKYTPSTDTYSVLNSGTAGPNAFISAIAVDPATGYVYVTGNFTSIDGVAAARIAYWDGAAWNAMGSGMTSQGRAIHIGSDGNIYVGGDATNIGGVGAADRIAYWDGSMWVALGTGLNNPCYTITEDAMGNIYAGGSFTTAGGNSANRIAKYDGSTWSALGDGFDSIVWRIRVRKSGDIVASGQFTVSGSTDMRRIALWNGAFWTNLGGTTITGTGFFDFVILDNGTIYTAGSVTNIDNVALNDGIAFFNGSIWLKPDLNLNGSNQNMRVGLLGNDLYIGFSSSGTGTGYYAGNTTIAYSGTAKTKPKIVVDRSGGTGTVTLTQISNVDTRANLYFD